MKTSITLQSKQTTLSIEIMSTFHITPVRFQVQHQDLNGKCITQENTGSCHSDANYECTI